MNNIYQDNYGQASRVIYTPSIFAKDNLFYLQEIGKRKDFIPHISSRYNLDSFLFIMVEQGSGIVTINNKKYHVNKNSIIFIDCHNSYKLKSDANNLWSLSWIHFNGPNMAQIYQKYLQRSNNVTFVIDDLTNYQAIHQHLLLLANDNDYVKDMLIMEQLSQLLTLLMRSSYHHKNITTYKNNYQLNNIIDYLTQNFNQQITLDQLAKQFNINKFYLSRIFKQNFHTTIMAYLNTLRIKESKQLLRFSDESMQYIAIQCGFNDVNYFIRSFKKIEAITPLQYRLQWKTH